MNDTFFLSTKTRGSLCEKDHRFCSYNFRTALSCGSFGTYVGMHTANGINTPRTTGRSIIMRCTTSRKLEKEHQRRTVSTLTSRAPQPTKCKAHFFLACYEQGSNTGMPVARTNLRRDGHHSNPSSCSVMRRENTLKSIIGGKRHKSSTVAY